jgi:hypothetical protein
MLRCFNFQKYKILRKKTRKKNILRDFYFTLKVILNLRYEQINQSIYLNIHIHYHTKILI